MRKLILIVAISMSCVSHAAENIGVLTAQFEGTDKKNGHTFTIKQNPNGNWDVEYFFGCPSYPCDLKRHTIVSSYTPEMITNPTFADAGPAFQLGDSLKIEFIDNGFAPPPAGQRFNNLPSYWQLVILEKGEVKDHIRLHLRPVVSHSSR
jgi:hypothetical protein